MKTVSRFILALSLLSVGVAGPVATTAYAGDVHVGVGVSIGLPRGAVRVHVGRDHYYYHRGVYYRPTPRGYVIVRPPYGARVRVVPRSYVRVVIGGSVYYRDADIYYRAAPGGYYEVVEPPVVVTAPIPAPPPPAAQPAAPTGPAAPSVDDSTFVACTRGTERFFFRSGMFFQKTDGNYVLVDPPIGALAEHLPGDSVSVTIDGTEYFRSGDALFKLTKDGFMVAGKA